MNIIKYIYIYIYIYPNRPLPFLSMVVIVVLALTLGSTLAGALATFSRANLTSNTHPPHGWDLVGYAQVRVHP